MVFWLKHQTANCPCSINLQDFCHQRISLDSSIKSEKREFVLLAKARIAGKENLHNFVMEQQQVDRSGFDVSKCGEYFQDA